MRKNFKNIFVIALMLFLGSFVSANEAEVKSDLEKNTINIGDQFNFSLQLRLPEAMPFQWPIFYDTLTKAIEIIRYSKIDTTALQGNMLLIRQVFTLTVFDTGFFVVPPIPFYYGNDLEKIITSEPFLINVFSIGIDLNQPFKPNIGPLAAPITFREILPWILLAIVFIAIVVFIIRYLINKKPVAQPIPRKVKPKIPPHKLALEKLEKLKNDKLWQRDLIKEYHSQLADILRQYIEDGYQIQALEMTTWEIIRSFSSVKIESRSLSILRETLELADLVKFAKFNPLPEQHQKSMQNALDFVMQTMLGLDTNSVGPNENQKISAVDLKDNTPQ